MPFAKCPKGPEIRNDENHFVIEIDIDLTIHFFCTYVTLLYDTIHHNSTLSLECVAISIAYIDRNSILFTLVCQSYTNYLLT